MYECTFCFPDVDADASSSSPQTTFTTNMAKDFKAHLMTMHYDQFKSTAQAASFIASIYNPEKQTNGGNQAVSLNTSTM